MAQQTDDYNPYCPICESCGEDGCCSPLMCEQSPEGHYCNGYLASLKFGYKMDRFFQDNIYHKLTDECKDLYDKEWDKQYYRNHINK